MFGPLFWNMILLLQDVRIYGTCTTSAFISHHPSTREGHVAWHEGGMPECIK